jgi:hypothetical protein
MVPRRMRAYVTQVGIAQKQNAKQAFIATARAEEARVIREQTARAGIAPGLIRIVDGVRNGQYENVRENGVIILQWKYLREIAAVTMARLKARAPEVSGEYKRSLKLFVGDAEAAEVSAFAQRITVVATAPYSRRLEVGKDAQGGPFVVQVSPHIVAETAQFLARDYAGVAQIKFTYEDVEGPAAASRRASTGSRRGDRQRDVALRYPAIRIVDAR